MWDMNIPYSFEQLFLLVQQINAHPFPFQVDPVLLAVLQKNGL
jgi:hypothetical protein